MHIKLRQLANAVAVWQHGSFRRAAEAQHLSQPALSRSVQSLEESLGVLLFDRLPTEIAPTAFGAALLRRAAIILDEAAELEREMRLLQGLELGQLSVAMGVYPAELSGNLAIAEMLGAFPELQFQSRLRHWRDVERLVRSRQVDIGFAEMGHLLEAPDLRVEPIGRHEVFFFCRAGHPLLANKTVAAEDLDAYPVAGTAIPSRVAHLFPRNCHIDPVNGDILPAILFEDLAAVRTLVAATDAVGLATVLQLEPWLRSGELAVLPLRASWLRLDYGFIVLQSRSLSPAAAAFVSRVRKIERRIEKRNRKLVEEFVGELKSIA